MTMQQPQPQVRTIELPAAQYPMLTRMVSEPIFGESEEPVAWALSKPHPFIPDLNVVRMFLDRGDGNGSATVEIYSVSPNGTKGGVRHIIPLNSVRIVEEAMPIDVFVEELAAAEGPNDDGGSDEPNEVTAAPEEPTVQPVT